jgi:RNA polymerase II subunit A small phosphatase-like protein
MSNLDPNQPSAAANGELSHPVTARDQLLPAAPQESGPSPTSVTAVVAQVPARTSLTRVTTGPDSTGNQENAEGDARIENTDPLPDEKEASPDAAPRREEVAKPVLPPPPPVPQAAPSQEAVPETSDAKQQWLLPPIAPRFKGKKCLVLDLDETLVHSSFKVRTPSRRQYHS